MIKLNLGSGEFLKEGYVNVDYYSVSKPDVEHDLSKFPYPFPDNHFDLVEADHCFEHLPNPFAVMKEVHRISKNGAKLIIRVPHFSRGFTHSEHKAGFDVTFPYYFNPNFTKSGYYGVTFDLKKMELHYIAFFHLLPYMGVGKVTIFFMRIINAVMNFFANLSPKLCSRIWCFWFGGFEEIEFNFIKK